MPFIGFNVAFEQKKLNFNENGKALCLKHAKK